MILESRRRRTPGEGQRREGFVLLDMRLESAHPAKNISASSPNGRGRLSESLCRLEEDGGCPSFLGAFLQGLSVNCFIRARVQFCAFARLSPSAFAPFFESPLNNLSAFDACRQ